MSRTRRIGGHRDGYTESWQGHAAYDRKLVWHRWIWIRHAPAHYRRTRNRLYRRKANRELARYGEVVTRWQRDAAWLWW